MKTKLTETKHQILLLIDPFAAEADEPQDYVNDYIRVSKRKRFGSDGWSPAEINWSAVGATTPERADLMAAGLVIAVVEARMMDERLEVEDETD
jgi:hypothetical protein